MDIAACQMETAKSRPTAAGGKAAETLRTWGLDPFPGANIKSPWPGHLDLAVKGKTFAYLSVPGEPDLKKMPPIPLTRSMGRAPHRASYQSSHRLLRGYSILVLELLRFRCILFQVCE